MISHVLGIDMARLYCGITKILRPHDLLFACTGETFCPRFTLGGWGVRVGQGRVSNGWVGSRFLRGCQHLRLWYISHRGGLTKNSVYDRGWGGQSVGITVVVFLA